MRSRFVHGPTPMRDSTLTDRCIMHASTLLAHVRTSLVLVLARLTRAHVILVHPRWTRHQPHPLPTLLILSRARVILVPGPPPCSSPQSAHASTTIISGHQGPCRCLVSTESNSAAPQPPPRLASPHHVVAPDPDRVCGRSTFVSSVGSSRATTPLLHVTIPTPFITTSSASESPSSSSLFSSSLE